MKIAVSTMNGGLEDSVSPMFGRCRNFTFVDIEGKEIKNTTVEQNQFAGAVGGAGIQAAQFIINEGADVIIAGNFGPNATSVFSQSKIKIVSAQGNVKDVVTKYINGNLKTTVPQASSGMGMGMGLGGGRGMGRGMGMRFAQQPTAPPVTKEQEIPMLENQMKLIEQQLEQIKKRLEELKKK
ncbi:MAG: NifB/NifX family molybdenum-iron cluster-binding protein [Methanomicrobia archaeon]|nr:NifB/NifX family molybdenum-iron cluster-binding protein [Methanomicrobia archaeon]